jgi:hypothetical protein
LWKTSLKKGYPGIDAHPPQSGFAMMAHTLLGFSSSKTSESSPSINVIDPDVTELAKKIELVGEEGRGMTRLEVHLEDGINIIEKDASDI